VFRSGTKVGNVSLDGKSISEGLTLVNKLFSKPIYLNVESASIAVTLRDIGIDSNMDELLKATKTCLFREPRIFCQNTSNEPIESLHTVDIDREKLNAYLAKLESELQYIAKNNIVDLEKLTFNAVSPKATVEIDKSLFDSNEGVYKLIDSQNIKVKIILKTVDDASLQTKLTKELATKISARPLLIKYGRNPIYVSVPDIANFIDIDTNSNPATASINTNAISAYIDNLEAKYAKDDVIVIKHEAVTAIARALLYRATDYTVNNAVILPLEGKPQTNGEKAKVYLEVVKSQQRLYRFEEGKLTKTYIVSTGLTWETPAGEYKVLGKQKMAISYFGNWYMPNYLPIGLIYNQYRFGFHSIPYHLDAAGNVYSRDINTMGSPATGGCIQLTPEDSEELYEWASVGTPVYIYE
jgi:lipoprotein-anchoring transpeptidase ErfK/SrfK